MEKCLFPRKLLPFGKYLNSIQLRQIIIEGEIKYTLWVRREWTAIGIVVAKLLQPSHCSTSVYTKHLFDTVSLHSNRLTGIVWHSDQLDHRR